MSETSRKDACLNYLENIKGKSPAGFEETLTILQDEASTRGLDKPDIELIVEIIIRNQLRAGLCVPLIKCLIPKKKISKSVVNNIIKFLIKTSNDVSVTISVTVIKWLIGLWEYHLVNKHIINIFYDAFFFILLKRKRLEPYIAKLIYILTKPEDITRRQVTRLLRLQDNYSKPQKRILALLSLFKSYKPELVPEKIPTVNIESAWKEIPEILRIGFENAKIRNSLNKNRSDECFHWNAIHIANEKKKNDPLLPSIKYFNIGSHTSKHEETKLLFDLNNFDDIGKYYFIVDLPTNATSLLANAAGYHFLTFAHYEYQSRFSHNLYSTLRRAFIIESDKYSNIQKKILLDMTIECCCYMQQGIPVVVRFLIEYLPIENGEYRSRLLLLMEWSTFISVQDLEIVMAPYLKNIFLESSLEEKCAIIKSLKAFTENLFVNQKFGREDNVKPSPFLGQVPTNKLPDLTATIIEIIDNLIITGLNIHDNDVFFLSASLGYYETLNRLNTYSHHPLIHLAPVSVIYSSFVKRSCAILSRLCALLLQYREIYEEIEQLEFRHEFINEVENLSVFANDLGNALWYSTAFIDRHKGKFTPNLPNNILEGLKGSDDIQGYLSIRNHMALLPHVCTLNSTGLNIATNEDVLRVAEHYLPKICQFLFVCNNLYN